MVYEKKLIEGNFPCGVAGAETKRERDTGQAPPVNRLHVWWARRPLTPSRAAILGSILPADTPVDKFIKMLGIVKKQVVIGDTAWTIVGKNLDLIEKRFIDGSEVEVIPLNVKFWFSVEKEIERRIKVNSVLNKLIEADASLFSNIVIRKWLCDNKLFDFKNSSDINYVPVFTVSANPLDINERIAFASSNFVKRILGSEIKIDPEDLYGYSRAFTSKIDINFNDITVLDCTAGGGSIPLEAMRLGCNVIANDLNPVATVIEKATLEYPKKYGKNFLTELKYYGDLLVKIVAEKTKDYYYIDKDEFDQVGLIYCRTIECPHCHKKAPLLNSFTLEKEKWMVSPQFEGKNVHFKVVPIVNDKSPDGLNADFRTVTRGVGHCLHCHQAITSDEIKRQACACQMEDTLYAIASKRKVDVLDKNGNVQYYKSGEKKGQKKVKSELFFREPLQEDFDALDRAKKALEENWDRWEQMDLIPTEKYFKSVSDRIYNYGIRRWCDMFMPRQLLGHLIAMETLHNMMSEILDKYGQNKGTAIITYLQYMIDKGLDYNSRQTLWENNRCNIAHTFSKHAFPFNYTFGEMIFTGIYSGLDWAKNQVIDAYKGICELLKDSKCKNLSIINGTASNLVEVKDNSVDVICVDPPYYNNVQYAELSDYFYVWQKRTFVKLYPCFHSRYTNKDNEAVANPVRDGSTKNASVVYEKLMGDIFKECNRVLKNDGLMTMMFTHKTQQAWNALTQSLIENNWIITSVFPVDSECSTSMHIADKASASSSIFLACRKRLTINKTFSQWIGIMGNGVKFKLQEAVKNSLRSFESLKLNPVDEMIASYGAALKVLSENYPVKDGGKEISPTDAMKEASKVVAQYQLEKITNHRLHTGDVMPETEVCLLLLGTYGFNSFAFDNILTLVKSLNIKLEHNPSLSAVQEGVVGYGSDKYSYSPILKTESNLRLVKPEERNIARIQKPITEWDIVQGMISEYRRGDIPLAKAYYMNYADGKEQVIKNLLEVWKEKCGDESLKRDIEMLLFSL